MGWKKPCLSMELARVTPSGLEDAKDQETSQPTASLPEEGEVGGRERKGGRKGEGGREGSGRDGEGE